ncbi:MAG: class I SAM-dependent methyltransferase [Woeseiaceae bacterium]|nr:class I SAM-dependent methyltransferase [Woeseiaceae bacterium]
MTTDRQRHWDEIYTGKPPERLGWYRPQLETPIAWIRELGLTRDAGLLDVGAGASTLIDDLVAAGFENLAALDISAQALAITRKRLGDSADRVNWIVGDITTVLLPAEAYALWHDRAVFHFLTDDGDRAAYLARLERSLKPRGHALIGVFAPEAPPTCSGLPVRRYSLDDLVATLGPGFRLELDRKELHVTPGGVEQMYLYAQFRRRASAPAR